ncbi:MAG: chemotaxis response regulator protein-glutamate methylesterase [Gammaproteobacteria bacterium]|nr:chemotaxis response regulator protein-glutamate methylesterase [Gammaproteobacteria bacterium]
MNKIRVLIVDDSALVRQLLTKMLTSDPQIEVVGTAQDPYVAREKIKELNPDVLTLDVEMPKMDGVTFLSNLMRLRPMPVVMVSSLTERSADITLRALELGAVDFVSKPKIDLAHTLEDYSDEIIAKIKMAANTHPHTKAPAPSMADIPPRLSADAVLKKEGPRHFRTTDHLIAIGASTGGTEAIKEVLMRMPPDAPGIVISQHIPEAFSRPFAMRMNRESQMTVSEAADGQQILPGHVLIAPGNRHLVVERDGARYICRLSDGPAVNRHRPSVDVMFRSVAQNAGPNAIGVILTGMGDDGARGMQEMHEAGAYTLAQDEKSSVVWGMPGEAVKQGGVDEIVDLYAMTAAVLRAVERGNNKAYGKAG